MGFIKKFLSVLLAHYSVFQNDFTQWNGRTNVYKDFFLCCSLWMWISVVFSFVFGVKCVCIIHVALEFLFVVLWLPWLCCSQRAERVWWYCRKSVLRCWTPSVMSPAPYLGFFPLTVFIRDDISLSEDKAGFNLLTDFLVHHISN